MEKFSENGRRAKETPVCSVCIANYNGIGFIQACIDSVLAQDAKFSYEIIVHDDASTDDSVAFIRNHYPNVRLIASDDNVGFCVSNNRMAATARGQYILLLNNDAALFPDALRTLHEEAMRMQEPAVLGLPQYDAQSKDLIDMGSRTDLFLNPIPNLDPEDTEVAMIVGACLWIPVSLWKKVGGFPAWFNTLAEDLYLCCAARLLGCPVKAIPRSGFFHWMGASIGGGKLTADKRLSTTRRRRALSERNKTFVMLTCYPAPLLALILPCHLLLLFIEGLVLALLKRDLDIWHTIYKPVLPSIWRMRITITRQRREIQGMRQAGTWRFASVFQAFPHKLRMLCKYGVPNIR